MAETEPSFRFNDATNPRAQLPALAVLGKNHHSLTLIPGKPIVHAFLQPHYGLIRVLELHLRSTGACPVNIPGVRYMAWRIDLGMQVQCLFR
jgi:hypothetical protein